MASHPGMLIAYDDELNVIATLDYLVQYADDASGTPLGLVDFAGHEEAGGRLTDVWSVEKAAGSGSWPEWLGSAAHRFRVERGPDGRIGALIHRESGHRRERGPIEQAIAARVKAAAGEPADIRDLVGGPDLPLKLDLQGRSAPWRSQSLTADLPRVARRVTIDQPKGTQR